MIFDNLPSALPFIRDGRLVAMVVVVVVVVVVAPQRVVALPEVPTFAQVGLEPVNRMAFYGVLAPKGTPRDVVDKVNAAAKAALADPTVKRRIEESGSLILGNTPEEFSIQIRNELNTYRQVVRLQKLVLE